MYHYPLNVSQRRGCARATFRQQNFVSLQTSTHGSQPGRFGKTLYLRVSTEHIC